MSDVRNIIYVVLDGANIATIDTKTRSITRLVVALEYFEKIQPRGVCSLQCVAFLPNHWLNIKPVDGSRNGAMETDDWSTLQQLVHHEKVVLTPSHSHDDYYIIDFAVQHDGFIVTNDMFRDHIESRRVFQGHILTQSWIKERCIDFTFFSNQFLPNSQKIDKMLMHQPKPKTAIHVTTSHYGPTDPDRIVTNDTSISSDRKRPISSTSLLVEPSVEDERDEDAMIQDQARKKNVDMDEHTAYRFPRHLLPYLRGENDVTLTRFQDHTNTYIVLPAVECSPRLMKEPHVAMISIFGAEPNRMQAVQILDQALVELQHQFEYQQQQQYQQHHDYNMEMD